MFWKKKVTKNELGVSLVNLAVSLANRESDIFDSIYNCNHLSKDYKIRCTWETTYFYISMILLYTLTYLPRKKNVDYKDVFSSFWDEYKRFLMLGNPSTEELQYHIDSTDLRYEIYGDVIEVALKNNENPYQEVAYMFLKAIRYIKLKKINDIDMESFFNTHIEVDRILKDDAIKEILKDIDDESDQDSTEDEKEPEYFDKDSPYNITLQNIQIDMIDNLKKIFKKFKIV